MKTGTRVEVDADNAEAWGFKIPALGTVIGRDPRGFNSDVVKVQLDQKSPSIYEAIGVNVARLTVVRLGRKS